MWNSLCTFNISGFLSKGTDNYFINWRNADVILSRTEQKRFLTIFHKSVKPFNSYFCKMFSFYWRCSKFEYLGAFWLDYKTRLFTFYLWILRNIIWWKGSIYEGAKETLYAQNLWFPFEGNGQLFYNLEECRRDSVSYWTEAFFDNMP